MERFEKIHARFDFGTNAFLLWISPEPGWALTGSIDLKGWLAFATEQREGDGDKLHSEP